MHEIVVFLGPSLPHREASRILEAEFRPPAKRGDIIEAVEDGARIIGLIDGVFFQDCSVAHREILYAIDRGIRVIGASSMGALRAAELDVLGMEGVGEIYRSYRDGDIVADDEVALIFDPETGTPLSEPLVNIRYTIREAVKTGVISKGSGDILVEYARSLYFPERTFDILLEASEKMLDADTQFRLRTFLEDHARDVKREDAIAALERIRELAEELGISV